MKRFFIKFSFVGFSGKIEEHIAFIKAINSDAAEEAAKKSFEVINLARFFELSVTGKSEAC